ncbi:D-alanyl-D-alanine carboxypeptidase/D-alanyl-D-alanine-endopeptidase [Zunongwangia endophytica]|uniref:D-alanyl-D-alanine carboxypeptidase/D-alanyl-D-alanine-endopeptidase n=1 Tax=Zunongwangia endophytica TaxID=1808945 RepID=A0ABV8H5P4_9FLAO|nr:D-alanyl-D-alanine carboxypeptidase [Zunongwangia endophytica]MDN3596500.1 D-alanyl-D-alanine carboxypeptidase [Zunongwangia endophytica]
MKNTTLLLFSLITIALTSCASSKKTTRNLEAIFENSPEFKQGFAGLVIYDPETKKTIFNKNGDKYFTPASNTKLVTFYTSLKTLGDSIPAIKYAIYGDSLIFKGTGDPSLLYDDLSSENILQFLAETDKKLFLLKTNYTEEHFGPGWAWDDFNGSYSAERNAFPIYGNTLQFEFDKNLDSPKIYPDVFIDSVYAEENTELTKNVYRDKNSNKFLYTQFKRTENYTQDVPFITSEFTSAKLLSDTIRKEVMLIKKLPKNIQLDQVIYSNKADSLYKKMLQESDNFIAEQLLLLSAEKLSDTLKTNIAINYAQENLLNDLPDKINWHDGSGLTRYNLFTPRSLIALINKITAEIGEERFKSLLPVGGESGTLKNSYKANESYIYAKSGSLRNNHSLSGLLITKSGKTLYFSFMNSNYIVPYSQLTKAMEEVLKTVRNQY